MNVLKNLTLTLLVAIFCFGGCRFTDNSRKDQKREESSGGAPTESTNDSKEHADINGNNGRGGIIDGNTGELITTEHNPWFIGKSTIQYCINSASTFSLPQAAASIAIQDAFTTWSNVFPMLQKYGSVDSDFDLPSQNLPLEIASKFEEVPCEKNPPLVFKLGISDADVRAVLPFTAIHTVGFARRTEYDVKTGQARGYIWIASDRGDQRYQGENVQEEFWKRDGIFYNVVAHEIGHIFGTSHVKNTIMDAKLPAAVISSKEKWKWTGAEFAWAREFPGDFCGDLSYAEDAELLKDLFGIEGSGDLQMCTRFAPGIGGDESKYALELSVKKGSDTLSKQIVDASLFSGTRHTFTGLYLRKAVPAKHIAFNFYDFYISSSFKGVLRGKSGPQPLIIERDTPLSFAMRVPHKGIWKLIVLLESKNWEAQVTLGKIVGDL